MRPAWARPLEPSRHLAVRFRGARQSVNVPAAAAKLKRAVAHHGGERSGRPSDAADDYAHRGDRIRQLGVKTKRPVPTIMVDGMPVSVAAEDEPETVEESATAEPVGS